MKAGLFACQRLAHVFANKTILFLVDNQTVVSYLTKQGGTRSLQLLDLTRAVYEVAERNTFVIVVQHIKGFPNVVADLASRVDRVVNTEWALSQRLFTWIQSHHGSQQLSISSPTA